MPGGFRPDFPLTRTAAGGLPEVPLSAIGSVLVLVGLLGGLGYGGWTVLQNIQRVQFAPVEELPLAVAEVDPLDPPEAPALEEPALTELASPVAATALADLYRQQELEVPILVPRDGPIAALDPGPRRPAGPRGARGAGGGCVQPRCPRRADRRWRRRRTPAPAAAEAAAAAARAPSRWWWWPSAPRGSGSTSENGTVLFESILEKGADLFAARGGRGAADLGRQLRVGLRAGRRGAARAARQRHQGDPRRGAGAAGDRRALRRGRGRARGDLAGLRRRRRPDRAAVAIQ